MDKILNITNGDSAVAVMKKANLPGIMQPWRDVLHDGPVPAGLSLEQLSEIRARFIIECGWGAPELVKREFIERDKTINTSQSFSEIRLWFEHDLYDQLQLLQILDWFYGHPNSLPELTIICTENYLGPLTPEEMLKLLKHGIPVTATQLKLANKAWSAFCATTPEAWQALLTTDTSPLPFLKGTVIRLLEEYPSSFNGLSRTAQQALQAISSGETAPWGIFGYCQEHEERRFLGDSSLWLILNQLLNSEPPLLKISKGDLLTHTIDNTIELSLTAAGKAVINGSKNWLEITKQERWIGGVHLTKDNIWCWDSRSTTLTRPARPINHGRR